MSGIEVYLGEEDGKVEHGLYSYSLPSSCKVNPS